MAGSSPTSEEVSKLAVPLLFGTLVNWMLYGVLLVQTYVYSYNFPDDRLWTKIIVYFLFAMETAQTALTGADVYYWFIGEFGNVERLYSSHFAPIDIVIMSGVSALMVQTYFCYRIWTLTKNVWLCAVIAVISATSAAGEFWGGFSSLLDGKFAVSKVARISADLSSTSAISDIIIAIAMTLLLRRASLGYCRFVMIRVVRLTVETNALTASLAITLFALFIAFPNEIYCTFPAAILGKLYTNTLLVSLNNRIYFRDHSESSRNGDTMQLSVASPTGISSNDFSSGETRLRSPVDVIKLESSHITRDLENGDSASINSDPSHATGDGIHLKIGTSIAQHSAHGGE